MSQILQTYFSTPALRQHAYQILEAEHDMLELRNVRAAMLNHFARADQQTTKATRKIKKRALWRMTHAEMAPALDRKCAITTQPSAPALSRACAELQILDRYETRALGRRNRAYRFF